MTWHAYAKLHLHTEHMLRLLERATSALGQVVRHFARTTCERFVTFDLPREEAARGRRKAAMTHVGSSQRVGASRRKQRYLNLSTYKFHRLGDYVKSIRQFGTTDNYNTQVVSCDSIIHVW